VKPAILVRYPFRAHGLRGAGVHYEIRGGRNGTGRRIAAYTAVRLPSAMAYQRQRSLHMATLFGYVIVGERILTR
jgi:hypothetical protein